MAARETRTLSGLYAEVARGLIETEPALAHVRRSEATICYLSSDYAKTSQGRKVLGECERVPDRDKWAIPCDFTITESQGAGHLTPGPSVHDATLLPVASSLTHASGKMAAQKRGLRESAGRSIVQLLMPKLPGRPRQGSLRTGPKRRPPPPPSADPPP